MVARLVIYLFIYAIPIAMAGLVVRKRLAPWLKERRERLQGKKNAHLLESHMCFSCLKPVDTDKDCYDEKKGWYHQSCLAELLGAGASK